MAPPKEDAYAIARDILAWLVGNPTYMMARPCRFSGQHGSGTSHQGTGRCRKHFGNAPNVIKAAERERAEAQAPTRASPSPAAAAPDQDISRQS
jgi:hypothetical protein